jgi:TolB-like protein
MPSPRALLITLVLGLACLPVPAAATTLTVLYFDNDSGDGAFQHLGKGLADMMITDLSAAPGVQVVEREKLEALLKELKLQRSRFFDPKTAQKIGKGLGAEYAVTGSFVSVSPKLRLDVRVIRIGSGEIVKAHQVTGQKDQFFDLYQRLVGALLDGLSGALRGGAAEVRAAAGKNRVDDVGAALDYGQALEQRDSGDLRGASQTMQKAMERAPGFGLARARYMQIMKELYAAKDVRTEKLSGAEGALLASMDRRLAGKGEAGSRFAYRILRGHLLFRRVALALGRPAKQYLPLLAAYRENQERLIAELVELEGRTEVEYNPDIGVKSVEAEDVRLARELGLPFPGTTTANKVMHDLVATMVFGIAPFAMELPRRVCFFKAEPALLGEARKLLKQIQERIDRRAAQYKKQLQRNRQPVSWADDEQAAQTIDLVQSQAQLDLAAGKREEAIARLQGLLTRYPKSRKFGESEQMIRGILDGSDKLPDGTPLVGCEDPR